MVTTIEIGDNLIAAGKRLEATMTSQGWSLTTPMVSTFGGMAPSFTVDQITREMTRVGERIKTLRRPELDRDGLSSFLADMNVLIESMQFNTLGQDSARQANHALMVTNMISAALPQTVPQPPSPKVDWEDLKDEKGLLPKDLARRLRFVSARLTELEPRSAEVAQKIADIEAARDAAEQLPTDMAELAARRDEVRQIAEEANRLAAAIENANGRAQGVRQEIEDHQATSAASIATTSKAADEMITKSKQALRGATSVGLARAFHARKTGLNIAGIVWTIGLIVSLVAALFIGANRVSELKDVLVSDKSPTVIWVNALLTLFGVGGPIWFAWLATKQIGTNFRLAEDYAFKASVSQAYEGYRTEAAQLQDPMLSQRLFSSALDRIEEAPIRLLDPNMHSSPLAELLSNPAIRKSLEAVPGITEKVIALIPVKGGAAIVAPAAAMSVAAAAAAGHGEADKDGDKS